MTSVTLNEGLTYIGESAFRNDISLTEITIPLTVTEIDSYAFAGCSALTSASIGGTINDFAETTIGYEAFAGCKSLTTLFIGNNVKSIERRAFVNCENLKKLHFYGSESEWNEIIIDTPNDELVNATKEYNYTK